MHVLPKVAFGVLRNRARANCDRGRVCSIGRRIRAVCGSRQHLASVACGFALDQCVIQSRSLTHSGAAHTAPLVVVLAGGLGTRLGQLSEGKPKAMLSVGGKPFLEHVLHQLAKQGFAEALLLVGYRAEAIENYFGDGRDHRIALRYSREPEPLGTGGALRWAQPLIANRRFMLLYGDLYRPIDYAAAAARHSGCCLAAYPYVPGLTTISCANVGLDASGARVAVYAKDRPDLGLTHVDAGFAFLDPSVLELLPSGKSNFEAAVYPVLAADGSLAVEEVDRDFFDIGNPAGLAHAREHFRHIARE